MVALNVIADYREKHLARLLRDVFDEVTFTQLPVGDYILSIDSEAVVIERKTVRDFVASVRSNRLWDQLLRMLKVDTIGGYHVKRRLLLIHGTFKDDFATFINKPNWMVFWSQLMGAYLEILYTYNTPIIYAESDKAFKAFMKIVAKREERGMNDKLPEAKWYAKPVSGNLPIKNRKRYVLSALPYIGDRLAENLLNHFITIAKVASASTEELQQVPKIGKKKAHVIYELFH